MYRANSCTSVFLAGMFLFTPSDIFVVVWGHSKNTSHFFPGLFDPSPSVTQCHTFDYPLKNYVTVTQPPPRMKNLQTVTVFVSVLVFFSRTFDPLPPSVTQCHTFDYPLKNYVTLTQPPDEKNPDCHCFCYGSVIVTRCPRLMTGDHTC